MAYITKANNLNAEIYRWTDKDGKVHFSDRPIADESITTLKLPKNNNIAKTITQNNQWQQNYNKTKQAKAEQAQEKVKQRNKNKAFCDSLKNRLEFFKQGGRIYEMSPTGERSYQSDKQLKAKKKNLIKLINKSC